MPRFDGTGPLGMGPGTGWGMGPCGAGRAWRRGWVRGLGYGRGFGWRRYGAYPYQTQITKKEKKEMLEEELKFLKEEMKEIENRLAELKKEK